MKQFEIYWADLNPSFGTEAGKIRPVVIIQTNLLNGIHPSTLVCPVTSKIIAGVSILRIHIPSGESGLQEASDIMIDQIRAIDNRRFKNKIGELSEENIAALRKAVRIILDM